MGEAVQLIPSWTIEDFQSETPYAWLYEQKDNKFLLQRMLSVAKTQARTVGYVGFTDTWNAYVESKNPRATILGRNSIIFPNSPVSFYCGEYVCDENGVKYYGRLGEEIVVCRHPVVPIKRVVNIDTNEQKLEVAFQRGRGPWKTVVISKETAASAQRILALAGKGIAVNSENSKELVKFFTEIESLNYDEFGEQASTSHMGWLRNDEFMPYCQNVLYDGDSPEFARMVEDFKPYGSEDVWMSIAKDVRSGQSIPARIALAASFAAPMVQLIGALPFFVHLWGDTGCGKTVALMLAASVWGNPTVGRYIKTFSGTKVSQELYAAFCGNMPILLDELQVISDRKMFDDIIYMLCEGASKGRGQKDGGLQVQRRWCTCILTTGEMPIVQGNSGGGAAVRTIEVNFGGQKLFQDARYVANTLKENYGHVGEKIIRALQDENKLKELKEIQKKYYAALSGDIQDKQVLSASILLAADALADTEIFHDGKHLTVEEVKQYLVTQEEVDINNRCYQWIMGIIASNPRRFDSEDQNNGELWGKIEDGYAFIIKTAFDRILRSEGYQPTAFLHWAVRKNKIKVENYGSGSGNNRLTVRKTLGNSRAACVALKMQSETDETVGGQGFIEVDGGDLPF